MFTRIAALLVVVFSVLPFAVASEDWPGEAGKSEFVKALPGRDFEQAKSAGMALCVYMFDPNQRNNPRGRYLETILSNAELRSRLKGETLYLKIRSDGSDVRGWPANLLESANKSAAIIFISSDFNSIINFDKNMQTEAITVATVTAALNKTIQYEKKNAAANADRNKLNGASAPKKEDPVAKAADHSKVPGLGDKNATPSTSATRRKPTVADE